MRKTAFTHSEWYKEYYVEVLKRLRDAVRRKRPRFWSSGDWLLHHDNAPAHSSNFVQQFLAKRKIVQLRQPPYSPDIAPCDYWMFPKLKMALKGKRFDDIETIQSNATRELKAISKSAFEDCFKVVCLRWSQAQVKKFVANFKTSRFLRTVATWRRILSLFVWERRVDAGQPRIPSPLPVSHKCRHRLTWLPIQDSKDFVIYFIFVFAITLQYKFVINNANYSSYYFLYKWKFFY